MAVTALTDPGSMISSQKVPFLALVRNFDAKDICSICEVLQTGDSRHCNVCNRCVERQVNHCWFTAGCIGSRNHSCLLLWLVSLTLYLIRLLGFCVTNFSINAKMSYKASIIITAIIALLSLPFASAATIHHSMLFCKGETEKRQALTPDDLAIFAKNKSSHIIEEIYGGKQRNPNDIISEEEQRLPNKSTEI